MLSIQNLSLTLKTDHRILLKDFSFSLQPGQKVAIIGEEGNGKSALLQTIVDPTRTEDYLIRSGSILCHRERIGYVPQLFSESMLRSSTEDLVAPARDADCYRRYYRLLDSIGISEDLISPFRDFRSLSGGERIKMALFIELLKEPTILTLDEPTNDLDRDTVCWLEDFLCHLEIPLLLISHDERLLEAVADTIIHIEQLSHRTEPRVTVAHRGYREYVDERNRRFQIQEQRARKEESERKAQQERFQQIFERVQHKQRVITRQDPATGRLLKKKMKSLTSMRERFEREDEHRTQRPEREEGIFMRFRPETRIHSGTRVLDLHLENLTAGDRLLARTIHLTIDGPQKIAIVGPNGIGKTTLLQVIHRAIPPRLHVGYMPQNYMQILGEARSAIEFLSGSDGARDEIARICTFLGSMNFSYDEMQHSPNALSGGQRAKLFLTRFMLDPVDVLLLDEPTRNLSPLSNIELRAVLRSFPGAIIAVSHDRAFLDEVCTVQYRLTAEGLWLQ
ncbi:MAG: ATP-binding cassette domain-containing protein [Bacillota bacterium]|nr:ATP-binding cassette domain-containing protein [Bacillota bacterium]